MPEFGGVIEFDVRDSQPDWNPFLPPPRVESG